MKLLRSIALIIALFTLSLNLYAQQTKLLPTLPLKPFEALYIDAPMDVELVKIAAEEPQRIVYDLGDNDPERFRFVVKSSGVLSITLNISPKSIMPAKATIYYHEIDRIHIKAAKVVLTTPFERKIADMKVDYQGSLTGEVQCEDLMLSVHSDSRVTLTGQSRYLTCSAMSRSKVELRGVAINAAYVGTSSGAVVAINAGDRLETKVGSGSVVKYWGEPNILRENRAFMGGALEQQ